MLQNSFHHGRLVYTKCKKITAHPGFSCSELLKALMQFLSDTFVLEY